MTKSSLPEHLDARLSGLVDASLRGERVVAKPRDTTPLRSHVPRYLTKHEAFPHLDSVIEEARSGAPDDYLARVAMTTPGIVRSWRKARGIRRPRGTPRRKEVLAHEAMDLYGDLAPDFLPRAEGSVVHGAFEPPEFVLRVPLDYDEFCRHVWILRREIGSGPEMLARAFGVRPRDVEIALDLEDSWLAEHGRGCTSCGGLTDPRYGEYCSNRCRGEKS